MALNVEQTQRALAALQVWRDGGMKCASLVCPACGQPSMAVEDRSARPHAEWYHLSCSACGLDETINVPLGASGLGDIN